jgi:predicted flap endonuclease-1-like 5' DNA nuclease
MPITREPQSIDDPGSEESAVRRTPLDQDDAYELQDHEFTLVADEPVEKHGWPYDEHTAPWSTLPPLPAWAANARALLEPPTLPRPLNDETPTLVEEASGAFSATALRALREELAQSAREAHAQQEQIEQLQRSLASAVAARAEAELKGGQTTAELLGRVSGQAARIRELEAALEDMASRREELEAAVKAAKASEEEARAAALAAVAAMEQMQSAAAQAAAAQARVEAAAPVHAAPIEAAPVHAAPIEATPVHAAPMEAAQPAHATAEAPQLEASVNAPSALAEPAIVASDSDTDLETTVEWITNAAPSVEVTIEVDEDSVELLTAAMPGPETTLEIDPDTDLFDAETSDSDTSELPAIEPRTKPGVRRRAVPRDDLQRIDGIGKGLSERLHSKGIRSFAQLAAVRAGDLPRFAKQLGVTPERIAREGWIRQARKLKTRKAKQASKRATKPADRTARRARKHA